MKVEGVMENCAGKLPVFVSEEDLNGGALKVLEIIRPTWEKENVTFKLLTDGISNKLVGCNLKGGKEEETVLIRVYGNKTDLFIDRTTETRSIRLLNKIGLAPQLYATFENGLAYEFVPGCTLSPKTVIQPRIYVLVATHMAKLHKTKVPNEPNPSSVLWKKLQNFLNLVPDTYTDDNKQKRYEEIVVPKEEIQREIDFLRHNLSQLDSPIVFAHNDLLLGNVIYTEEKNKVTFIDFEYTSFNYQAYDIGNHFAEFVGLENVDYCNYPNKELQLNWLRAYLSELEGEDNVTEKRLEKLYVQVNQFALAAHVFWGVWSLIQAEHSYIDFDFLGYAAIRLNEYFKTKEQFMSLAVPS